jgi:tol-pal system protein YbgF
MLALLTAGPSLAQKLSLGDRVSRLEQQSANQTSAAGQANVELLNRITQMQAEMQALRNQIEQLQNDNAQLKQQGQDQYVDLDSRLRRVEGGSVAPAASGGVARTPAAVATPVPAASRPAPQGDEQAAYSTAFDALKRDDFVASARGFQAYLDAYPQGALAPNARYWLGESYYVTQNYPVALKAFDSLLSQFPDSSKAPDALLKKGYCLIEMGQAGPGQQVLDRVIKSYPGTEVARLAASRLRALSLETH